MNALSVLKQSLNTQYEMTQTLVLHWQYVRTWLIL